MSDARRYAVWPNPRSRSPPLQNWKFGRFQKLSPPSFTMGAGNWPRILKLGHYLGFWIFGLVCHVTLKLTQTSVAPYAANFYVLYTWWGSAGWSCKLCVKINEENNRHSFIHCNSSSVSYHVEQHKRTSSTERVMCIPVHINVIKYSVQIHVAIILCCSNKHEQKLNKLCTI